MSSETRAGARWLLLLPSPPVEVSSHTLEVAFSPGLAAAIQKAAKATAHSRRRTILDIGVAFDSRRTLNYAFLQTVFSLMYKMSCKVCAENKIDLEYDNDVDVRFFLFANPLLAETKSILQGYYRNMVDLQAIAIYPRPWTTICFLDGQGGEDLLQRFLQYREDSTGQRFPQVQIFKLPDGVIMNIESKISKSSADNLDAMSGIGAKHRSVAVGGTFDHLHVGHKLLLTMTALPLLPIIDSPDTQELRLTIGITGDELLKDKKFPEQLESWEQRQASVSDFLLELLQLCIPDQVTEQTVETRKQDGGRKDVIDDITPRLRIRYVEILDPYGPTIDDPNISALVISAETRTGGEAINKKRQEKGWSALEVFEVDVIDCNAAEHPDSGGKSQDFRNKLSSTEIRSRLYDRTAFVDGQAP